MNELYLLGVEIDYDSEIFGSTFKFNNYVLNHNVVVAHHLVYNHE